jgi:hypothetical protein
LKFNNFFTSISPYEEKEKLIQGLWWKDLRERDYLENLGVDGSIILNLSFKKYDGAVDWMDLIEGRKKRWAVVNAEMNLRVLKDAWRLLIG